MNSNGKIFVYNAVGVAVVILLLLGMRKTDWTGQFKDMNRIVPAILSGLVLYETAFLAPLLSSGTATLSVFSDEASKYTDSIISFKDCEEDRSVGGSSQLANYRSISIFNSNSNKMFSRFLKQQGQTVNYNYFAAWHTHSAPDTDAFMSVGTLFATGDYSMADFIAGNDNLNLYKSRYVLPIAFTAQASARDFDYYSLETATSGKDYFSFRNDWYASLFESFDEDYFITQTRGIRSEIINGSEIDINDYISSAQDQEDEDIRSEKDEDETGEFDPDDIGLEVMSSYSGSQRTVYRINQSLPVILNYDVTVQSGDELYVNISLPRLTSGYKVYLDGKLMSAFAADSFYSVVLRLGSYEPGSHVRFSICPDSDYWTYLDVNFGYFDEEAFARQFSGIDTDNIEIHEADDGYISFAADVKDGEMILTSVPYEKGWSCYVDGARSEVIPYEEALISIDAQPGTHEIVLKFTPPGIKAGALLSLIGFAGLISVAVVDKKRKN